MGAVKKFRSFRPQGTGEGLVSSSCLCNGTNSPHESKNILLSEQRLFPQKIKKQKLYTPKILPLT
jgi:hypothetical protein